MKTAVLDKSTIKRSQNQKVSSTKQLDAILAKKSAILNDILSSADLSTLPKSPK